MRILNAVAAHGTGQPVSPIGVKDQFEGGFAQAMGMALTEAVPFDSKAGSLTRTLLATRYMRLADVPPLTPIIIEAYDETGSFIAKGMGEAAIMGACPVLANAILDTIGIRFREL